MSLCVWVKVAANAAAAWRRRGIIYERSEGMIFGIAPSRSCTKDDRREDFTPLRRSRRRVVTEGDGGRLSSQH